MTARQSRGVFIVVEGIDGAGTTTQIDRYATYLRSVERAVHVTREPSSGPIGMFLRDIMGGRTQLASAPSHDLMALMFAADRLDHIRGEVEPALQDGAVVLSDRYDLSSLAYQSVSFAESQQGVTTTGLSAHETVAWIRSLNRFARRPDVTLVVDVTPQTASARRKHRGAPEELYEVEAFQTRLAKAYAHAEALVPGDRIVHVHGDGDIDTVAGLVRMALDPFVGPFVPS